MSNDAEENVLKCLEDLLDGEKVGGGKYQQGKVGDAA